MAWIGAVVGMAASIVGGASQQDAIKEEGDEAYRQGFAIAGEREFEAKQHDYFASQERGAAQRSAFEERRLARITESRIIAVAAAGGGGVSDPTVLNIIGDVYQESEYRALTAIYEGGQAAREREIQATLLRYEGAEAIRAGQINLQRSKYAIQISKSSLGAQAGSTISTVASSTSTRAAPQSSVGRSSGRTSTFGTSGSAQAARGV